MHFSRSTTCSTGSPGSWRVSSSGPSACAKTSMRVTASTSASGCCSSSSSPGLPATRRTGSCSGTRCARGTRDSTFRPLSGPTRRSPRASGSMRSSIRRRTSATSTSSSSGCALSSGSGSTRMPEAGVHLGSGKVRDLYALDDERLLLTASDRISTFDVILPTEIPDKGRVLTGLSAFWFARTSDLVPNHLLALRDDGRTLECRRLEMLPIEVVVRGYLAGSGWRDYLATGAVCGHALPAGLRESE